MVGCHQIQGLGILVDLILILAIVDTTWLKIVVLIQMCTERRHFKIKIILEVVILPLIQADIILEQQVILLNKIEILIIFVVTVLPVIIIETIIFLRLTMRLVSKGTTMLP